ncbi:MAG: HIT domain-containing protein [Candidatus Schekmanbacteria bacterium]|nr:HIT domain-containing protein [Candidatus Schekmanbacteria bacterium]
MRVLFAPWRIDYIVAEKRGGCIFCDVPAGFETMAVGERRERLCLFADRFVVVMLNRYPYANGHLMVAPRHHVARLHALAATDRQALMEMVVHCEAFLDREIRCHGINIGANLGKTAGAGVEDHVHVHLVPRWEGDHNFITTIADMRVVPEALTATFDRFAPYFADLSRPSRAEKD